ncbi:MAG: 50S ribosomal protein L22, partial [Acetobacteraceae bacterium]|nr:50S ribosomal protein L22 [Acetobacteraceae bacterium]
KGQDIEVLKKDLSRMAKTDVTLNIVEIRKPEIDATLVAENIAQQVKKTLESAIANAENNHQLDVDRLVVSRAEVGKSIVMRRFHARGRGRAARVEKWFSHLRIVVAERAADSETDNASAGRRAV